MPQSRSRLFSLLSIVIGIAVTAALVGMALLNQIEHEKNVFHAQAHVVFEKIAQKISAMQEAAHGLNTVFFAETFIDPEKFTLAAQNILERHSYIESIQFAPKISGTQRDRYEAQMRDNGYVSFSINDLVDDKPGNRYRRAEGRDAYYPVHYVEPFTPLSARALGWDIAPHGPYTGAILRAIDSDQGHAAVPSANPAGQPVFPLFKAAYSGKRAPPQVQERRERVNGLLIMYVNAGKLLDELPAAMSLRAVIYTGEARAKGSELISMDAGGDRSRMALVSLQNRRDIPLGDGLMSIDVTHPIGLLDLEFELLFTALAMGVMLTVLSTLLIRTLSRRARRLSLENQEVQRLVASKTRELAAEQEQLKKEIGYRREAEAQLRMHRDKLEELVDRRTRDLANARDEALQANTAKSRFLMNISHELRTPLNAIIGYSELLAEELAGSAQSRSVADLEKILQAGRQLLGLIDELLDLSKIEAGKIDLVYEEFPVLEMLRGVEFTVQPLNMKNHNRFELHCSPDIGAMRADRKRVQQVLVNLANNAAKFTQQGTVTLKAEVYVKDREPWIDFTVNDTGIGIEPQTLAALFDEFVQASVSIGRKYGGSGLGLAISRRLCETMGGSIGVSSLPQRGSTFIVSLPLRRAAVPAPRAPQIAL